MREALSALAALALAAGCAGAAPAEKQPFPDLDAEAAAAGTAAWAYDPAPPEGGSAAALAHARKFPRAEACEGAARRLQRTSRDRAWELLKGCVARGDFTLLSRVVDGGWALDLKTRADASLLLARVVASRGGDVVGDLAELRRRRIPVFALGAAVASPGVYEGRLVLFRAAPTDVKVAAGAATAELAEFAVGISERYVASSERAVRRDARSYSSSDGPNASGESSTTRQLQRRFFANEPVPTGLEAIARLGRVDPFFEAGRQFVVLARFDGVREREGEALDAPSRLALVSVVAYFEPSPAMVE